jgi:hypothetical protein
MPEPIVFVTTFRIQDGALEEFKEATWKSMEFLQSNGPQLFAEVCIEENAMRFHSIQVRRDSELRWDLYQAQQSESNELQMIQPVRLTAHVAA